MEKYVCVFCDERKHTDTAHMFGNTIGICRSCYEMLDKTSLSLPYKGTRSVSYIMSPFEYAGNMRRAILDFKFHNNRAYAPLLAAMMREYINSYDIWDTFDCIIPVPLHESRFKERGYNQSELLAKHISEYTKIPMRTEILFRIRATKRQSSLKRIDRVLNVKDAFKCNNDLSGKKILLFDDICTTGNTLQSCADALKQAGAREICALTLAIHVVEKLPLIMY